MRTVVICRRYRRGGNRLHKIGSVQGYSQAAGALSIDVWVWWHPANTVNLQYIKIFFKKKTAFRDLVEKWRRQLRSTSLLLKITDGVLRVLWCTASRWSCFTETENSLIPSYSLNVLLNYIHRISLNSIEYIQRGTVYGFKRLITEHNIPFRIPCSACFANGIAF